LLGQNQGHVRFCLLPVLADCGHMFNMAAGMINKMGWWCKTHRNKRLFDHSFQEDDANKLLNDCWMIWI
jgi:hypothetical protein